jgi:hypothetical protein
MKKFTFLVILCLVSIFVSCNIEGVEGVEVETSIFEKKGKVKNDNVVIVEGDNTTANDFDEHCKTVNLIAGQNHIAGTVTMDVEGDNLIITYTTNSDWAIDATHLEITNCAEDGFPTTGSNNPKIGNFEYSSTHEDAVTEVTYIINLNDVTDEFCFAAHAEVNGSSAETAWAEGEGFGGNSWAMYVEADLTDCDEDDEETPPTYG